MFGITHKSSPPSAVTIVMAIELAFLQLAVFDIISRVYMPMHCMEHQDWGWMALAAAITPDFSTAF